MTPQLREVTLVETFLGLTHTLVDDFDLVEFLCSLAGQIVKLGFASEVGILLADDDGDLQVIAASHERGRLLELIQVQQGEGPCRDAYRAGRPIGIEDLREDVERWPVFARRAVAAGFLAVQAVPLRMDGETLGVMDLFSNVPRRMDAECLGVVQGLADAASIGMVQRRQFEQSETVRSQLQHALHSRVVIEQAKGAITRDAGVSLDVAFELLRGFARRNNRKVAVVAREVVDGRLPADCLAVRD